MLASAHELPELESLWNFQKPAETEQKFRELAKSQNVQKNAEYRLELQTQIARTLGLQRKFEEAFKELESVKSQLSEKTPSANIRYYLELGRVMNSSKKPREALPHFMKAYELAILEKNDNLAVDAAHMVAIAEQDKSKVMDWNLKALSLAEKSKVERARNWKGSLYNNIGWAYHSERKYEDALRMFKKALEFREAKGETRSIRIAKWCVARTLRSLAQNDEALKIQLALEAEFNKDKESDPYVFEELGELYLLLNQKEKSKKYFGFAYELLAKDEWFKANESARLARILDFSK